MRKTNEEKGKLLKKGKQKKGKPNYKQKETKGTGKRKIHFEEIGSDLQTDIEGNELYEDDVSDDGDYFIIETCA
jgi:hypothetical protein